MFYLKQWNLLRRANAWGWSLQHPQQSYVMPLKESVGKHLRKIAILKSQKKYKEVKVVATSLRSKFKVVEIAALSGENIQVIYRLLSPEQKRRLQKEYVKKLTQEDNYEVINIYNDDEVSYSLPDIKYAELRFMHFTLRRGLCSLCKKMSTSKNSSRKNVWTTETKECENHPRNSFMWHQMWILRKFWKN